MSDPFLRYIEALRHACGSALDGVYDMIGFGYDDLTPKQMAFVRSNVAPLECEMRTLDKGLAAYRRRRNPIPSPIPETGIAAVDEAVLDHVVEMIFEPLADVGPVLSSNHYESFTTSNQTHKDRIKTALRFAARTSESLNRFRKSWDLDDREATDLIFSSRNNPNGEWLMYHIMEAALVIDDALQSVPADVRPWLVRYAQTCNGPVLPMLQRRGGDLGERRLGKVFQDRDTRGPTVPICRDDFATEIDGMLATYANAQALETT